MKITPVMPAHPVRKNKVVNERSAALPPKDRTVGEPGKPRPDSDRPSHVDVTALF